VLQFDINIFVSRGEGRELDGVTWGINFSGQTSHNDRPDDGIGTMFFVN
jgi:hypothetical protein